MSTETATPPLSAFPPVRLGQFAAEAGLSLATLWRYRRRGWLRTVLIGGQHFVTREAVAEFNRRAERGELVGTLRVPQRVAAGSIGAARPVGTFSPTL